MTECEKLGLHSPMRDLCEGRGLDGRPDPPWAAVVTFRNKNFLPPLPKPPEGRGSDEDIGFEHWIAAAMTATKRVKPQSGNPGAKLEQIFTQLNLPYREACNCRSFAWQMDYWGAAGCRHRFEKIVQRLRDNARRYSLLQHAQAAVRAVRTGLAFLPLDPLDPFPGLVEAAIRQAEEEAALDGRSAADGGGGTGKPLLTERAALRPFETRE